MMAPRRIGIDVTSALTQGGGIGRYTRELVQALAALPSDNRYRLFSAKITDPYPVPDPLPHHANVSYKVAPLTERWLYRLWYRARLPLPVQWVTGKLDLFHSPDFVLPPVSGGIPTLLTVHDLSFVHYPQVYPEPLVSYLNAVVPWSVQRATHILADSQATKEDLLVLWGVAETKVSVLYSGVSERFAPVTDQEKINQVRAKYGLRERPYILAVGTVQPRKNYQMLVRAFKGVSEGFAHNLVIAGGKGWMEEEMLAEVQRQGLQERVIITGFVADEDLPALYSGAALLAFPSLYEGFGLPILEAMACGVPALISNVSSLPEVGGEAAVQLSPADEQGWGTMLGALLGDRDKLAEMRAAGLQQAQNFSWGQAAEQLLAIYERLTNGK
jgi:glycosyltransferase involved in cell wall biosynthesis